MNILMLTKLYFPHIGGVEKHVEEVARRLVKKGHKVTVITLNRDKKLPETETRGGVKILRLPYSNSKINIWKYLWLKRNLIKKADIIHYHDIFFWHWPFKPLYPLKKVFTTFHGWEGKYPVPYQYKLIRKINELLSSGNICIGDYLLKHYGTKTKYVSYGGVHKSVHDHEQIVKKKISQATFIGRLEKDLGLVEYLKAFKAIKAKHGLKITFVGDGSCREQAEKIGKVTGMVKDIKPYLKKPCLVFSSSYLTILEAMLFNRPVFALYQNQLKKDYLKLFPGAKYIHLSGSAGELVNQVNNSLQRQSSQIKKARQFAKSQTWDKVVSLYLRLWNQN